MEKPIINYLAYFTINLGQHARKDSPCMCGMYEWKQTSLLCWALKHRVREKMRENFALYTSMKTESISESGAHKHFLLISLIYRKVFFFSSRQFSEKYWTVMTHTKIVRRETQNWIFFLLFTEIKFSHDIHI